MKQWETPPRTWGRRGDRDAHQRNAGNTPTHVGKTSRHRIRPWNGWKHPHARGEDKPAQDPALERMETPPRTWGRPRGAYRSTPDGGNTPTHVGKTDIRLLLDARQEKHPHARGEDTWNLLAFFLLTFNKELGRHLNQKLKIFPFGRNTGLQAKKSNSSVDESLSPQCTWL